MSHKPIFLQNISFSLFHKTCFEQFSATIHPGAKIGIIGPNGGGKSTLLKIIQGLVEPTAGRVVVSPETVFGFVPQLPEKLEGLSGGQRFNAALSQALAQNLDALCLDEPTNHLDGRNRRALMRMLQHFDGTLFVVSHDVELLRTCVNIIWYVQDGIVTVFSGTYDVFVEHQRIEQERTAQRINMLETRQAKVKQELRREQERSARRARANKHENDRKLLGYLKGASDTSLGKHQAAVGKVRDVLAGEKAALHMPEQVVVSFDVLASNLGSKQGCVIEIRDGKAGYTAPPAIVQGINFLVTSGERIALVGDNGSGKSTLMKALLGDSQVVTDGFWHLPKRDVIGYLDQHYMTLDTKKTVLETVQSCSSMNEKELRSVLNDFLFRKNEEVFAPVATLSGGEKARLALACIALKQPPILLLDEITNNLDLQTREHVIAVLNRYPGTLIVISHDENFLERIDVTGCYKVNGGE